MATGINTTINGLIKPINPFLGGTSGSIGGISTAYMSPTQTTANLNQPAPKVSGAQTGTGNAFGQSPFTTSPTATGINFGSLVPNSSKASPSQLAMGTTANGGGTTQSSANPYQMTTQEASGGAAGITAYNNRIASLNGSSNGSSGDSSGNGNTGNGLVSAGLGTGGGAAPTGQEYNSQGVLVPKTADSTGTTFNQNSYTATAPTYPGLVGGLTGMASQPSAAFTTAQNTYNEAAKQLKDLQTQEAQQNANIQGSRTNLAEAGGEQGIMQNLAAGSQAALTGEMTAEQAAMQNATAQQGTQQSGLTAAMQGAAPQQANIYGTYDPTTMQYTGYGNGTSGGAATAGGVETQVQQGAAVQSMTGILSQAQGLSSSLSSAIDSSGYNPNDLGAATTYANGVNQWLQNKSGNPQYQNAAMLISEVANKYAAILNQSGGTPTSVSQVQQQIINGLSSGQQIKTMLANLDANAQTSIEHLKNAAQTNSAGNTNGTTDAGGGTSTTTGGTTFGNFFG